MENFLYSSFFPSDEIHLLHQFGNVVTQLRGALDAEDAAHDLHPKGGNRVELLKRGRFEAACKNLAVEAIQAKVVVCLCLLANAHHLAFGGFSEVGINGILARLEVASGLKSALRVDEMSIGELKGLFGGATLCGHNNTLSVDDMWD